LNILISTPLCFKRTSNDFWCSSAAILKLLRSSLSNLSTSMGNSFEETPVPENISSISCSISAAAKRAVT
jgi:hypothetical protein